MEHLSTSPHQSIIASGFFHSYLKPHIAIVVGSHRNNDKVLIGLSLSWAAGDLNNLLINLPARQNVAEGA